MLSGQVLLIAALPEAPCKAVRKGWTRSIHSPALLVQTPAFKGRVDTEECTFFHNGSFSNWWLTTPELQHKKACAEVQFEVNFNGKLVPFLTAELFLMLFKERAHDLVNNTLKDVLPQAREYGRLTGGEAKKAACRFFTHEFWNDHTFQALLDKTACLSKFAQGRRGEGGELLNTEAIIIEAALADGSFGVAMNTTLFLNSDEHPESFTTSSEDDSELLFTIEVGPSKGLEIARPRRHANALGKSLQFLPQILAERGTDSIMSMKEAVVFPATAMRAEGVFHGVVPMTAALTSMQS